MGCGHQGLWHPGGSDLPGRPCGVRGCGARRTDHAGSNAQAEGQITKLKLIKRLMYGRAGFELLRRRVLLAT